MKWAWCDHPERPMVDSETVVHPRPCRGGAIALAAFLGRNTYDPNDPRRLGGDPPTTVAEYVAASGGCLL
jgi:hypothetical protein